MKNGGVFSVLDPSTGVILQGKRLFDSPDPDKKIIDLRTGVVYNREDFLEMIPHEQRMRLQMEWRAHDRKRDDERKWITRQLDDSFSVPPVLYKYVPKHHLERGFPCSLRSSQIRAMNDVMECSVTIRKQQEESEDAWRFTIKTGLKDTLGFTFPLGEFEKRRRLYGDLMISTVFQDFLNPRVGIVSLSTDPLIPTMWAHYAANRGFVIGYHTEKLRPLGFELRKLIYLENAPAYLPTNDNSIKISFVDEKQQQENARQGIQPKGIPVLEDVLFLKLQNDWKEMAKLLLVKGKWWEYEKEVRLLVDQNKTRPIEGKTDENCLPVNVLDIPAEAVKEIYVSPNTSEHDIQKIHELMEPVCTEWRLNHVSSHAFRMQKTSTIVHSAR